MIKVRNINGSPETTPDTKSGVHIDSEWFYFFETEEEFKQFSSAIMEEQANTKESKFARINEWHSDMFRRIWSTKEFISEPYESEHEINSAAINANSGCQQEAIAILHWYWNTWNIISNANIDENTNVGLFVASLPVFGQ